MKEADTRPAAGGLRNKSAHGGARRVTFTLSMPYTITGRRSTCASTHTCVCRSKRVRCFAQFCTCASLRAGFARTVRDAPAREPPSGAAPLPRVLDTLPSTVRETSPFTHSSSKRSKGDIQPLCNQEGDPGHAEQTQKNRSCPARLQHRSAGLAHLTLLCREALLPRLPDARRPPAREQPRLKLHHEARNLLRARVSGATGPTARPSGCRGGR